MNRSEIRAAIRTILNEESPGFWSNDNLNVYINLANKKVNSVISNTREDYFTLSATFQTVAGQKSYSLPTDCHYIRRMEIYDPNDPNYIIKIDEQRFPRTEANGDWPYRQSTQPKEYTIYGTQFNLLPIPDTVYPMRLYYDAAKADLSNDSDVPACPTDYHDLLVFYACLLAKKQNEDDDVWYGQIFSSRKQELIESLASRGSDDIKAVEAYLEGIV